MLILAKCELLATWSGGKSEPALRVSGADARLGIVPKSASTAGAVKREKLNKSIPAD